MRIALVGNPNSGKTTLFNALTGSNQYVGNWPGVTVEKKGGRLKADKSIEVTDLPGIYSLSPYTLEEVVARNFIIEERPDAILNIVDGTNLERNLYLTTQLLEMGTPVVVAVNMADLLRKQGQQLNLDALSARLSCPVVEISALKGEGIDAVVDAIQGIGSETVIEAPAFSPDVEDAIERVVSRFYGVDGSDESSRASEIRDEALLGAIPSNMQRFYAIKLLEGDERIAASLPVELDVSDIRAHLEKKHDDDVESIVINERYAWVSSTMHDVRSQAFDAGETVSDKIDRVVTNRILALPIFVVVMFLVYYISVSTVGTFATDWANDGVFGDGWFLGPGADEYAEVADEYDTAQAAIESYEAAAEEAGLDPRDAGFAAQAELDGLTSSYESYDDETGENEVVPVTAADYAEAQEVEEPDPSAFGVWVPGIPVLIEGALVSLDCADWLQALILDGIVAGVGAVLGFIPQMMVLFLLLAFLESCGYLSRVAFILDRVFRRFGLSGKSFIPVLIGTGCGVPGVMASRTIENQNDRRMTVMTTTFIPCGAKLPIIALFASAIFGGVWWVAPSAYFLGIAAILCSGVILKKTRFFAGEAAPFVMELPAYHLPTVGAVLRSMWERCWSFIKKAGTIILLACILVWLISTYGVVDGAWVAVEDQSDSLLAVLGGAVAWLFAPLGWGDWQATSATVTGLIAKENVVGTMAVLYEGDAGWYANLQAAYTPLVAYSFMAFNLLCAPCFAAMGAIKREMNNRAWFWAAIGYECGLAYAVALCIYQIGGLLLGEVAFGFWTVVALLLVAGFLFLLFRPQPKGNRAATAPVRSVDAA